MPNTKNQTLLGFDFGIKRIGIAIGQTVTKTANPLTQINNNETLWRRLDALISEWKPDAFVLGLPLNMNNTENKLIKHVRHFSKQLTQHYQLSVYLIDERLSSKAAYEQLTEQGYKKPSKAQINSAAAQIILQDWLQQEA